MRAGLKNPPFFMQGQRHTEGMDKTTKAFVLAAAAVVVAAGVPFGINAWKNLLTDKRSFEERFEDCRYERINKKIEATTSGLTIPEARAAAENFFEEATAECRAKVAP